MKTVPDRDQTCIYKSPPMIRTLEGAGVEEVGLRHDDNVFPKL